MQPDDHPGTSEVPSPEARKPPQQRLPAGLSQRAGSAAAGLFKRSTGRAISSSADAEISNSMPMAAGGRLAETEREQSASRPEAQLVAVHDSNPAERRSASASGAEAGSDAEPAAKRRRTSDIGGAGIGDRNGRFSSLARISSADRTGSDASGLGGSQERDGDTRDGPMVRNGSSLGRRRNGAGGAAPNGGAGRRRRSGEGTAAPVTSLIEVRWPMPLVLPIATTPGPRLYQPPR